MKTIITGASSYVGSRLFFDLKDKYDLLGTYHTNPLSSKFVQLDLTNEGEVKKFLEKTKPEIIIHAANYPSARNAINNEENFSELNEKATHYLVDGANTLGAKVVFVSSLAAENSDNLYGKLKGESEELVKTVKAGYVILRPSLIVGFSPNTQNDRPFNRILKCLDNQTQEAEFDISWQLQPAYVGHLTQIIDKTIKESLWNKTFPVFINEIVTQYQIASDILSHFGIKVKQKDMKMTIPLSTADLSELKSYNLKPTTYAETIDTIIKEIESRDLFKL